MESMNYSKWGYSWIEYPYTYNGQTTIMLFKNYWPYYGAMMSNKRIHFGPFKTVTVKCYVHNSDKTGYFGIRVNNTLTGGTLASNSYSTKSSAYQLVTLSLDVSGINEAAFLVVYIACDTYDDTETTSRGYITEISFGT